MTKILLAVSILVFLSACNQSSDQSQESVAPAEAGKAPNFLVIIADDMGAETMSSYGENKYNVATPNIDQLAANGLRFQNAWAQPECSTTRSSMLTGRQAFRTGAAGAIMYYWNDIKNRPDPVIPEGSSVELQFTPMGIYPLGEDYTLEVLPPTIKTPKGPVEIDTARGPAESELMLPALLKKIPQGYTTAALGKWHLTDGKNSDFNHPNNAGFDHYKGTFMGVPRSFFAWREVENGELSEAQGYVDVATKDSAVSWISKQDKPWLAWVSFTNPHSPFHKPPVELLQTEEYKALDPQGITAENVDQYFAAQIEALDTVVGQLLAEIPQSTLDNTYVIFIGDNGSVQYSYPDLPKADHKRWKGSLYQRGLTVPFIVSGPGVRQNESEDNLVHVVDIFDTIIDLAGGDTDALVPDIAIDSTSFAETLKDGSSAPHRTWIMSESGPIIGNKIHFALRDDRYKLIHKGKGVEFYDLQTDPDERQKLDVKSLTGEALASYENLIAQIPSDTAKYKMRDFYQ